MRLMRIAGWALALSGLAVACVEQPTGVDGVESAQFKKGGKKPGGGGGPTYTVTQLGPSGAYDVNDAGLAVGFTDNQPVLWDANGTPMILPTPAGGNRTEAQGIDASGTKIIGFHHDANDVTHGILWEIDGSAATWTLPTGQNSYLRDINESGQIVGSTWIGGEIGEQRAVMWNPDGLDDFTPRSLGELPGHDRSLASAVNDAGHMVGRSSGMVAGTGHPVLWTIGADGHINIHDLTPNADGSGDQMATSITDLRNDGTVMIGGYTSIAGTWRPTRWTVDVATGAVTDVRRASIEGRGWAINNNGEVLVSGNRVWFVEADILEQLPAPANCSFGARDLNNVGMVVGWSYLSTRKGKSCRDPTMVAVTWTRIE